jgi:hypothetical protein
MTDSKEIEESALALSSLHIRKKKQLDIKVSRGSIAGS